MKPIFPRIFLFFTFILSSLNFDTSAPLRVAKELNAQAQGDRFADGFCGGGGGDFHPSRFPPEGNCLITLVGLVVTSRLKQMEKKIKRLNISISDCFSKIFFFTVNRKSNECNSLEPESTKRFIEDQAVLWSYDMLAPPPSSVSKLSLSVFLCVAGRAY